MTNMTTGERERFEAWARTKSRFLLGRNEDDTYGDAYTREAWAGWQAATAAQPERAREPVAWFVVSYTQPYPHYLQLPPLPQLGEGWQAVPLYFGDPKGKP